MMNDALVTLYCSKTFLTGTLKGLTVPMVLKNISLETATRFAVGSKGKDCITKSKWIITDASFQNYHR